MLQFKTSPFKNRDKNPCFLFDNSIISEFLTLARNLHNLSYNSYEILLES